MDRPGKADIILVLPDGSEVEAHKVVLAQASPYFETEFSGRWEESNSARVDIHDDKGVFRELIAFIYKQNLNLSLLDASKLWGLLYCADFYGITGLKPEVEDELRNHIKNCRNKPDLLDHWQESQGTTLGDPFRELIMDQIETHSELLMKSEEFLELRIERAKEVMIFELLRVTEGEIFKYAAAWCLKNSQSEAEAKQIFQSEFNEIVDYERITNEDFVENVLPNSHIMEQAAFERARTMSIVNPKQGLFTRAAMKLPQKFQRWIRKFHIGRNEVETQICQFPNFDVSIQTRFNPEEMRFKCKLMLQNSQIEHDENQFVRIGVCLRYDDKSAEKEKYQKQEVKKVHKWRLSTNTYFVFQDVNQIDTCLAIEIVLDARNVVKLPFIRQDQILLTNIHSDLSINNISLLKVESNLTVLQACEKKLGLEHVRLWQIGQDVEFEPVPLPIGQFANFEAQKKKFEVQINRILVNSRLAGLRERTVGSISHDSQQEIGAIMLQQEIGNRTDRNFFLEVSNCPLDQDVALSNDSSYCMIYKQEQNDGSIKFIGNKHVRHDESDKIDPGLVTELMTIAGVTRKQQLYEEYLVNYGVITREDTRFQIKWRRMVGGAWSSLENPVFVIVFPKEQK